MNSKVTYQVAEFRPRSSSTDKQLWNFLDFVILKEREKLSSRKNVRAGVFDLFFFINFAVKFRN